MTCEKVMWGRRRARVSRRPLYAFQIEVQNVFNNIMMFVVFMFFFLFFVNDDFDFLSDWDADCQMIRNSIFRNTHSALGIHCTFRSPQYNIRYFYTILYIYISILDRITFLKLPLKWVFRNGFLRFFSVLLTRCSNTRTDGILNFRF